MSTRDRFEAAYAEAHDMPIETFAQYRMGDTYRLPGIAKAYRFWNMGFDACEEGHRRLQMVMVDQSPNVVSIQPLADKTEFVLPDEKFDSFTALLADNPMSISKKLQDFLAGKRPSRWTSED